MAVAWSARLLLDSECSKIQGWFAAWTTQSRSSGLEPSILHSVHWCDNGHTCLEPQRRTPYGISRRAHRQGEEFAQLGQLSRRSHERRAISSWSLAPWTENKQHGVSSITWSKQHHIHNNSKEKVSGNLIYLCLWQSHTVAAKYVCTLQILFVFIRDAETKIESQWNTEQSRGWGGRVRQRASKRHRTNEP